MTPSQIQMDVDGIVVPRAPANAIAIVADASVASLSSRYASFSSSKLARVSQAGSRGGEAAGVVDDPGSAAAGDASGRPENADANRRSSDTGSESPWVAGPVDSRS